MGDHKQVTVDHLPKCDFFEHGHCRNGGEAHFDGKTIHGPWANMCEHHFSAFGIGIGLGRGQKLVVRKEET